MRIRTKLGLALLGLGVMGCGALGPLVGALPPAAPDGPRTSGKTMDADCMASWGWSDPGLGLGTTGPGALPLDIYGWNDLSGPPRLAGGQIYAIAARPDDTGLGPAMCLRAKRPRRWRFSSTADLPIALTAFDVNCEDRDNPDPVLVPVTPLPPYARAWEVELRAGWYHVDLLPERPPALRFKAEPVE